MDIIVKQIKKALLEKDMNQKEFCEKTKRDTGNFNRKISDDNIKLQVLKDIVNDLGYELEINFIDKSTGEKL